MVYFAPAENAALFRSLRNVPGLGGFVHRMSHRILPADEIEDAEIAAFRGAEKLLKTQHPLVLCEMYSDKNDRYVGDYFNRFGHCAEVLDGQHVLAVSQTVAK